MLPDLILTFGQREGRAAVSMIIHEILSAVDLNLILMELQGFEGSYYTVMTFRRGDNEASFLDDSLLLPKHGSQ